MTNIILLSDGTGNAAARIWRSNVWRLFQSLDLTSSAQIACYGDGVGTSAFKPLAILGGAFGWGLKRNVLDLYKFLSRNYKPGDDIYAFGFSRGAFTVRVMLGIVGNQGLIRRDVSEAERDRLAKAAYRAYRAERFHSLLHVEKPFRALRDACIRLTDKLTGRTPYDKNKNITVPAIRFIGVWDTVAAYGLPIEEMTRGISQWLWPLELPSRTLSKIVGRACHALSLDDERTTFHPVLWTEAGEAPPMPRADGFQYVSDERISQVWFAGAHSNVGGGYPDDSLAQIPLLWMMKEAEHCDLKFKVGPSVDPDAILLAASARDKDGRLYDPRQGLGGYYRYGPRKLEDLTNVSYSKNDTVAITTPKIHESALTRLATGAHVYAPIGFPQNYAVVDDTGRILSGAANPYETPAQAAARVVSQEYIWNRVWQRRVVYFLTVAASLHLALFPLIYQTSRAAEVATPFGLVPQLVRFAGAFLPAFFNTWLDAFAANPARFLIGAIAVVVFISLGVKLSGQITDQMRTLWRTKPAAALPLPDDWVYRLRTNALYRATIRTLKRQVVPFLSAVGVIYVGLTLISQLLFNIGDAAGFVCRQTPATALGWQETKTLQPFKVNALCWASGVELTEGRRYRITISETKPWKDARYDSDVGGFEIGELPGWSDRVLMSLFVPLRRVLSRPWFRPIARIGSQGTDEYFFDPERRTSVQQAKEGELDVTFRARHTGELFLYVNDAVLGVPGLADYFYRNNDGEAKVTIEHIATR